MFVKFDELCMILDVQKDLHKLKTAIEGNWLDEEFSVKACKCAKTMPVGAFAVQKVKENAERYKKQFELNNTHGDKYFKGYNIDLSPTKYSSKYMNSVWGMYNRYSCHNLKKVMDKPNVLYSEGQQKYVGSSFQSAAETSAADSVKGAARPVPQLPAKGLFPFLQLM